MTCRHLQQLIELCSENQLRFSSSDMVHIVCKQCQKEEVCPSLLVDEYETLHPELDAEETNEEEKQQDEN